MIEKRILMAMFMAFLFGCDNGSNNGPEPARNVYDPVVVIAGNGDIAGMVSDLHARGYKFLTYANPFVVKDLEPRFSPNHFEEMEAGNWLMKNPMGETNVFFGANIPEQDSHADLTLPGAREYIKDAFRKMVSEYGFNAWTGESMEGGTWVTVDAAIGSPPVYSLGADRQELREAESLSTASCR